MLMSFPLNCDIGFFEPRRLGDDGGLTTKSQIRALRDLGGLFFLTTDVMENTDEVRGYSARGTKVFFSSVASVTSVVKKSG